MRIKAVVFNGNDGVDEMLRIVLELEQPPLGAVVVEEVGDQFRLQLVSIQFPVRIERADADHLAVCKVDGGRFPGKIRQIARIDFD